MGGFGSFTVLNAHLHLLRLLLPLKLKMFETSQFIEENIIMLCSVCGGADIGQFADSLVCCI